MNEPTVSGLQLLVGRIGRRMKQEEVAALARVSRRTVSEAESGAKVHENHMSALLAVYESVGVTFDKDERGCDRITFCDAKAGPNGS